MKRARYRLILVRGSDLRWLNRERLQEVEAGLRTQHKWLPEQDLPFSEVVLYAYAADCVYIAAHALQTNLRERNFPDRRVRRRVPPEDLDEHRRALRALHQRATAQQAVNPVSFGLTNEWYDTITADKKHHLEHFTRGMT